MAGSIRKNTHVFAELIFSAAVLITAIGPSRAVFAAEGTTVVVACSDYQYPNTDVYEVGQTGNDGGAVIAGRIAGQLVEAGVSSVDGFLCAGDYDYDLSRTDEDTAAGIASLTGAVSASGLTGSDTDFVFLQGNHDSSGVAGGTSESGNNDPASGAYGVYVLNERDYSWGGGYEYGVMGAAQNLRDYCYDKIWTNFTAPVFVISHVPLHYSLRTYYDGDGRYANYIFDVLNDAASRGLNIIYLFGHDHSEGWDDYLGGSKVFLGPGDTINISDGTGNGYTSERLRFVYMNAGYTGYYKNQNTETSAVADPYYDIDDLSMTCFVISGDTVEITRCGVSGTTVLKNRGIYNRYKNEDTFEPAYAVNENTVTGAYTAIAHRYCGPDLSWDIETADGENVLIISGTGPMFDYSVDSPAPWAYSEISKAVIEEGVTDIGDYAFYQCFMMKEIEMPDSLESIGKYAFNDCGRLKIVDLPENVTVIGDRAFYNCYQMKELHMYRKVNLIGKSAFAKCSGLADVYYAGTQSEIDAISIGDSNNLLTDANWHYLTYEWFDHYSKVAGKMVDSSGNVDIEETVAAHLKEASAPSDTTQGIFRYVSDDFEDPLFGIQETTCIIRPLEELEVFDLPEGLTIVDEEAFSGTDCQAVIIPDSCTRIGARAFANCDDLVYVYLPASAADLADDAFEGCEDFVLYDGSLAG